MKYDWTSPEWEALRTVRRNRAIALAVFLFMLVLFAVAVGFFSAHHVPRAPLVVFKGVCLVAVAVAGKIVATPSAFDCPNCVRQFETEGGFDPWRRRCQHCGASMDPPNGHGAGKLDSDVVAQREREIEQQRAFAEAREAMVEEESVKAASREAPRPAENVLTRIASARGWDVLRADAIAGEVGGVRVAVERDESNHGCTYVDADAPHIDEAALSALRVSMKERVPRARVVVVGPILRIEILGNAADSHELEDALDAVERSLPKRSDGVYR